MKKIKKWRAAKVFTYILHIRYLNIKHIYFPITNDCFQYTVNPDLIPSKPSSGCPFNTLPNEDNIHDCCCDGFDDCCWSKCPLEGTDENLEKLKHCGIELNKWSYGKLERNGDIRTFVAQGGKDI